VCVRECVRECERESESVYVCVRELGGVAGWDCTFYGMAVSF